MLLLFTFLFYAITFYTDAIEKILAFSFGNFR